MNEDDLANMIENKGGFGKLKEFKKCRNPFICRICNNVLEKGSGGYNQSDYTNEKSLYPIQTKVCLKCGELLIKSGTKVKEKQKKEKKIIKDIVGCGKETIYQKPNSNKFWKCGEESLIGIMLCDDCKEKKHV